VDRKRGPETELKDVVQEADARKPFRDFTTDSSDSVSEGREATVKPFYNLHKPFFLNGLKFKATTERLFGRFGTGLV
jgi:hypothetical protein